MVFKVGQEYFFFEFSLPPERVKCIKVDYENLYGEFVWNFNGRQDYFVQDLKAAEHFIPITKLTELLYE